MSKENYPGTLVWAIDDFISSIQWKELDKISYLAAIELKADLHRAKKKAQKMVELWQEEQQTIKHSNTSEIKDC